MQNSNSIQSVTDFLNHFITSRRDLSVLLLKLSVLNSFDLNKSRFITDDMVEINNKNDAYKIGSKQFDLIIGDTTYGKVEAQDAVPKQTLNESWMITLSSLLTLKEDGQAFILIEPSVLFSQRGKQFQKSLSDEQLFLDSVFELPENLLYPETNFVPIIIRITKQKQDRLFIGKLTSDNATLIKNLKSRTATSKLETGLTVDRESFSSFKRLRVENEINNLQTQYDKYTKYKLKEAGSINSTRSRFIDNSNSIYIPKFGTADIVTDISTIKVNHSQLFQVALNPELIKAEFLSLFFQSDLGVRTLELLRSETSLHHITKSDIDDCLIPIPGLKEQDLLILTDQKLSELQETVGQLRAELSMNPQNANSILEIAVNVHGSFNQITIEDQILGMIRKGESKHLEFKETFSKDTKTGKKEKYIEKSSLKNIVGFLNADGGTLLIGVSDSGEVKGVNDDFFDSPDKYKLNFKNALFSKVGSEFYPLIDYELFCVSGLDVLKVDCKPSSEPCFFNQEEFFVRTNPATDELKGKKLTDYIKRRFS